MKVVSVVNYKGGVGKTTLTANLGAGLAQRGNNVLLIDLDPQASLTFSFFTPHEWREQLAEEHTIRKWYDSKARGKTATKLSSLIVRPGRIEQPLRNTGGLDMIVSHQDLVGVDTLLAGAIDTKTGEVPPSRFIQVYRRLATGLSEPLFSSYQYVLIDCAPNFQMMTKNAIIASDHVIIPSRPDYLSNNGINHFAGKLFGLINDYNTRASKTSGAPIIERPREGVLFTMVDVWRSQPIEAQNVAMNEVRALGAPIFKTYVRDRKTVYPTAPQTGIPAMLTSNEAAEEMNQLIDEFIKWTEGTPL